MYQHDYLLFTKYPGEQPEEEEEQFLNLKDREFKSAEQKFLIAQSRNAVLGYPIPCNFQDFRGYRSLKKKKQDGPDICLTEKV